MMNDTRMFLSTTGWFSAAHRLKGYDGPCSNLHGHNWKVELSVCPADVENTSLGILIDFRRLSEFMSTVLEEFDHKVLLAKDDLEMLGALVMNTAVVALSNAPTAEFLAAYIATKFAALFEESKVKLKVLTIQIWESENHAVFYDHPV